MPTVPAMPPIEKTTRAGTPLATQKAPFQSMARFRAWSPFAVVVALLTDIVPFPQVQVVEGASLQPPAHLPFAGTHCADFRSRSPLARPNAARLFRQRRQCPTRRGFGRIINDAPVCRANLDQFCTNGMEL